MVGFKVSKMMFLSGVILVGMKRAYQSLVYRIKSSGVLPRGIYYLLVDTSLSDLIVAI